MIDEYQEQNRVVRSESCSEWLILIRDRLGAMELGTIIRWTLAIMINDLSICPHYNISDRRKVHSIIETSDRSVSSPWLLVSSGPRDGQLFPWWFIITILQVLFDVWLWAVFVIIVFFCFNCRHHPGRRMVNGHNRWWVRSEWWV